MGEVRAMSAIGGSEELNDSFREVLTDRIVYELSEMSAEDLLMLWTRLLVTKGDR